jgi:hypothetical protein
MKYALVALLVLLIFPEVAGAKLYAKRPTQTISCNAKVTLGVASSPDHKGSRRVQVSVFRGTTIVYQRTVKAPLGDKYEWQKQLLPCGASFVIRYSFPAAKLKYPITVQYAMPAPETTSIETPANAVFPAWVPEPTPGQTSTPKPIATPSPTSRPTVTPIPTPVPAPTPTPASTIALQSGSETHLIRMIWWRGPPEIEGDFRVSGSCVWAPGGGTCVNGAPPAKTFRPQNFRLVSGELWMDMPQYRDGAMTYSHYPIPVKLVRSGCTFQVQHGRAGGRQDGTLEFKDDPPGLEILPNTWTMTGALCTTFDPLDAAWVADLNQALAVAIPPGPYSRPTYPY